MPPRLLDDLLADPSLQLVINLRTGRHVFYGPGIDARGAVMCAYAQYQSMRVGLGPGGDFYTWEYERVYQPIRGRFGWHLGDWSAPVPNDQWIPFIREQRR